MSRKTEELFGFILAVAVLLGCISATPIRAYYRAKAFNEATGKNVSTWDALFLDLRVDAPPK